MCDCSFNLLDVEISVIPLENPARYSGRQAGSREMSRRTKLRIQMEELRRKLRATAAERDKLRTERNKALEEATRVRSSGERGTDELERELSVWQEKSGELEQRVTIMGAELKTAADTIASLKKELESSRTSAELERLRAVEEERREWREILHRFRDRPRDGEPSGTHEEPQEDLVEEEASRTSTQEDSDVDGSSVRWALLGQQVPSLEKFRGDNGAGGETIQEWIEQLELMAEAFGWDERTKLVHLTTRLAGTALAFFRSCTAEQRRSYTVLKEELLRRFTPVHVRSVQSALFHERVQQRGEVVDTYAQELKKLFTRAYPKISQEGGEEGKAILASRFVAGLRKSLQEKLTGTEGDFNQLLSRRPI